jgi:HSP20 family protein
MSIIKTNGELLHSSLPTFFNDFWTRDLFNWGLNNHSETGTTIPAVNIKETSDHFEVEMAAPGMTKKDFKIRLEGNELTIFSEKKKENEVKENENYSRREFSYQSFERNFTLPKDVVDAEKIKARYENGVLYLLIPKKAEAKQRPPKMIEVA